MREVFCIALAPAVLSTAILILFVREPGRKTSARPTEQRLRPTDLSELPPAF
jgi:hypothetical protein